MDEKGKMRSPVAKDESDGLADDESTSARPTRKPSATTTLLLTSIPKGRLSSTKRPYISLTKEECEKTEAEASPPVVQQCLHSCANAEDTNRSNDRPVPKSFGKCARAKTIISVPYVTEESDQSTKASRVTCSFGPRSTHWGMETRRGLEHLRALPMVQPPALMRTRAARDASPVVQEKQPKNVPATREHEPRKAKLARFAPGVPSDAPAKGTRSNAGNTRITCTWQKPKRYTDYI
ncbi:hypothetical protein F4604DRAFT_1939440 [Suillus subluteus]|nr:hypothetical protein F4604DRAFT_1939440 [Suillus subluteus]